MDLIYRRPAEFIIPPSHDRSTSRIHLTQVLHHIESKLGTWEKYDGDFESREGQLTTALGLAWEEWFAKSTYTQPPVNGIYHFGEIERNEIVGTPDGLSVVRCEKCGEDVEAIDEFKCSRFGMKQWDDLEKVFAAPEWWHRLHQVQSYCQMLGCRHGRFWIYHINGDYKHGPGAVRVAFEEFLVEFSERELEQNWRMILNHLPAVRREVNSEDNASTEEVPIP